MAEGPKERPSSSRTMLSAEHEQCTEPYQNVGEERCLPNTPTLRSCTLL